MHKTNNDWFLQVSITKHQDDFAPHLTLSNTNGRYCDYWMKRLIYGKIYHWFTQWAHFNEFADNDIALGNEIFCDLIRFLCWSAIFIH